MQIRRVVVLSLSVATLLAGTSLAGGAQKPVPKPAPKTAPVKPKKEEPKKPEPKKEEPKKPEAKKTVAIGQEVDGAISFKDTKGTAHTLKDLRGKIVVVDFWSMGAPESSAYDARLAKIVDDYSSKGVVFLAVDPMKTDADMGGAKPYEKLDAYLTSHKLSMPVSMDPDEAVAMKFGATTMPEVFVIDAKGVLRYHGAIDDDPKGDKGTAANAYLAKALEALAGGKDVPTPTSAPAGAPIKK